MNGRWRLHRVGMLNFWFYDEQEFPLQGGRVLFRGANGAGKSVTMQSFLPLVLDGDTRPHRLDPFGSRDRKVEYYLLGDETLPKERQSTDRTGYLWMEFYHTEQDRYATIGIGLRARRGNHQLDFWGFILDDNRRIGHEFQLFKSSFVQGVESKIPLDWKELRESIGNGGQVVKERKEYRRLVNKLLFKFENEVHYQELLDLLIQLRSPKLSKEFKPTTIYDILNSGLPPLTEDELRPLAEVLEAIDQIGDRKMELETHIQHAQHLSDAYDRYNEYQLCLRSDEVVQAAEQADKKNRGIQEKETEWTAATTRLSELDEEYQSLRQDHRLVVQEISALEEDEAFKKEFELKTNQDKQLDLTNQIGEIKGRLKRWQESFQSAETLIDRHYADVRVVEQNCEDQLEGLAEIAADMEFAYHNVFHTRYLAQKDRCVDDESLWTSWKQGLDENEDMLKNAFETARKHSRAKEVLQDRENELGRATEQRDLAEKGQREAADFLESVKEDHQNRLYHWRKQAGVLQLEDEVMTKVLHLLTQFPQISYEEIKKPILERANSILDQIRQERSLLEVNRRGVREDREMKRHELNAWKQQKEPEPPRSVNREQTRLATSDQRKGIPFYASCEFLPSVSEPLRATLESVLQETGILDAWVGEHGLHGGESEEEEFWVATQPIDFGYTLADFLRPTPPEDQSLTAEQIDRVLRSILIGDPDQVSEHVVLSVTGRFRMGTLLGQVAPKERAEYIGKESRRLTRLQRIAELEKEIEGLDARLGELADQITSLQEQETCLQREQTSFPEGTQLFEARDNAQKAQMSFKHAVQELGIKTDFHKKALQDERLLREQVLELTSRWQTLKTESRINQAISQVHTYRSDLFELRSSWQRYLNLQEKLLSEQKNAQDAKENIEEESELLVDRSERLAEVEAAIKAFSKVLKEMGVEDKHRRLTQLRRDKDSLSKRMDGNQKESMGLKVDQQVFEREVEALRGEYVGLKTLLHERMRTWQKERNLNLVPKWRDVFVEKSDAVEWSRRILKETKGYDAKKAESIHSTMVKVFFEVQPHLHAYVLELSDTELDRQIMSANMDRMNPISPEQLLKDLKDLLQEQNLILEEKEKELIEKVLIQNVGVNIRQKIQRAEQWVKQMNTLMRQRETSSGLQLKLHWNAKPKGSEAEMDTADLVGLLRTDYEHWDEATREQVNEHFRARINQAKDMAENQGALRKFIHEYLDYREWYLFKLEYRTGEGNFRELTDARFNVLSGGEKAMSMYIPLFCAAYSRFSGSAMDSPKLVSLDEAFAGVDDDNVRDMFELLTQMEFDYMMTSQALWGCYDTVPHLAIYEIIRPKDAIDVMAIPYIWDGKVRTANFEAFGEVQAG